MSFVLDCSIAVAWCFEDESTPEGDALLSHMQQSGAFVPALWHLEVANVLVQAEKRGRITADGIFERIDLFQRLLLHTDHQTTPSVMAAIVSLARTHRLTAYDAAYLELALRRVMPLATKGNALVTAAKTAGIKVL